MTAFNVVRFCVKPDREQDFIAAHRNAAAQSFAGLHRLALIKTGESRFCLIGEWENFDAIVDARIVMISLLDSFRDCLDDMGGGLGLTDPVSGEAVMRLDNTPKPAPRRAGSGRRKPAAKARPAARKNPRAKAKKPAKAKARKPAKKAVKKTAAKRRR